MWSDPGVARFIGGRPSTDEEVWARLMRYIGHWELLGFGYWVMEERASGRFVGEVGLANFHRELSPPLGDTPESGWALAAWARGRGFATEAVKAVLGWADLTLAAPRTACLISPENEASVRVATKCGYVERLRTTYKSSPTILLERPRREAGAPEASGASR